MRVEKLLEQRLPGLGRHLYKVFGAAAREGEAEAVDALVALARVDDDVGCAFVAPVGEFDRLLLLGEERRTVGAGDEAADGLCRGRGERQGAERDQKCEFFQHKVGG